MHFRTRGLLAAVFVVSLLIQMHMAANGYAVRRPGIAFASTRDGNSEIYVMDSDGSNPLRLTINPARDYDPSWSPDGNTIAYASWDVQFRRNRKTIHLMTAEGEHLKQLSEEHNGSDTFPDWFAPVGWSVSPAANYPTIWGEIKRPTAVR